ncbi:MAG: hypothetical protein U5K69_11460 [Balneolaceae bacterium]|nr:hypothetical protein [Balneolaceae bacterium]
MIEPEVLLSGYARGVFPMADSRDDPDAKWYTASRRGLIPLDNFRVSSNVRRIIRNDHYRVEIDTAFRQVMEACADRETTWISRRLLTPTANCTNAAMHTRWMCLIITETW